MQKARAGGILQAQEKQLVHYYWLAKNNFEKAHELEQIYKNRDKTGYETDLPRSTQEGIEQRYHYEGRMACSSLRGSKKSIAS